MDQLNYHHLRLFWVIAKEGSVTKAAKLLRLSQPTLSSQLKQLEVILGAPLFDRTGKRLVLNDHGRKTFEYADAIFRLGRDLLAASSDKSERPLIPLRVGVEPGLPEKIVHKALRRIVAGGLHTLETFLAPSAELLVKLSAQTLDAALVARTMQPPIGLSTAVLERSPYVIVGGPDVRSLRRNFPSSLTGRSLILPTAPAARDGFLALAKKWDCHPRILALTDDLELARVMALSGDGLAVLPKAAVSDLVKNKDLMILGDDLPLIFEVRLLAAESRLNALKTLFDIGRRS